MAEGPLKMANGTVPTTLCVATETDTNLWACVPEGREHNIATRDVVRKWVIDFRELQSRPVQPDGCQNRGGGCIQSLAEHFGHSTGHTRGESRSRVVLD